MHYRHAVLAAATIASASSITTAHAQPATLARDIRTVPDASAGVSPDDLAAVGGALFFAGRSDGAGVELWTSDGTAGGTRLVADLWPGAAGTGREPSGSSHPRDFHAANGLVFFTADDGNAGREVWRTDGTAAGTFLLKDIAPGPGTSLLPGPGFATVGNTVYFYAQDTEHGRELWRTDGTTAGTQIVADTCLGPCWGTHGEEPPAVLGGYLFFQGQSGLWRSDGSAAGTYLWTVGAGFPRTLTTVGTRVYFAASDAGGSGLWVTDNSPGTTRLVKRLSTNVNEAIREIVPFGGGIVFRASDDVHGPELWRSDGTEAGTVMVKDLAPAPVHGNPAEITVAGGIVYFSASDGQGQRELWRSDGTEAGTARLALPPPGATPSWPTGLVGWQGQLAFIARSPAGDRLWSSDGTLPGTRVVGTVTPVRDPFQPRPSALAAAAGAVYFNGSSAAGAELWRSDLTDAGTAVVRDHSSLSSYPRSLAGVGGRVVLSADDGTSGREPWTCDGSSAGTVPLGDLCPGACSSLSGSFDSSLERIVRLPDAVVFAATTGGNHEPWTSDGTPAGTQPLGAAPGTAGLVPRELTSAGDRVYYTAVDMAAAGSELWSTDGTTAGTAVVRDIAPGPNGSHPQALTAVGDLLYFLASDGVQQRSLWTSDGTAAGTRIVDPSAPYTYVNDASAGAGLFFFRGGYGLSRSDGTTGGTFEVPGLPPYTIPEALTDGGAALYFRLPTQGDGSELWRSDGGLDGTSLVRDIAPGSADARPAHLARVGGLLYFAASDVAHGVELWRTDGTTAGTVMVKDIVPGPGGSVPAALAVANGRLYFAAYQPATGVELWTSDGTEAGTVLVQDLAPGPSSSTPSDLAAADGVLYFVADDGMTGREPWSVPLPPSVLAIGSARAEGDAGSQAAAVEVRIEGSFSSPIEVAYATQDGTAGAGNDYVAVSGVLTFLPAGPPAQTVTVDVLGDTVEEPDEDFRLVVSASGGAVAVGGPARVVVRNDDSPVTIASAGGAALEGHTGEAPTLAAAVRLSGPRGVPVTVDYATSDGTAVASSDYEARVGTLTFAPGVVEVPAEVVLRGDRTLEFDETFTVALSNPVNATVAAGLPQAAVIVDDEGSGRPGRSLAHGAVATGDLTTPAYFRLATHPLASYEAVLDNAGGSFLPRLLRRWRRSPVDANPSSMAGATSGRVAGLRWFDVFDGSEEYLQVATFLDEPGTPTDVFRVRLLETTLRGPRFQNTGTNATTLVLQNAGTAALGGRALFFDEGGAALHDEPFTVPVNGVFVKRLSDIAALAGRAGSLLVVHDGAYGAVAGKTVTVDSVSGLAFDHLLTLRPH
jgi:ELWxxDGT repeat protein